MRSHRWLVLDEPIDMKETPNDERRQRHNICRENSPDLEIVAANGPCKPQKRKDADPTSNEGDGVRFSCLTGKTQRPSGARSIERRSSVFMAG